MDGQVAEAKQRGECAARRLQRMHDEPHRLLLTYNIQSPSNLHVVEGKSISMVCRWWKPSSRAALPWSPAARTRSTRQPRLPLHPSSSLSSSQPSRRRLRRISCFQALTLRSHSRGQL